MSDVVITGGTGLVGRRVVSLLTDAGHRVRVATRHPGRSDLPTGAEALGWDGQSLASRDLAGAQCVIHLAGEPIFGGLPTRERRKRMVESRVASTHAIVDAIASLDDHERPKGFLCASAVGIYGDAGDEPLGENDRLGSGFLADLCRDWESAAARVEALAVRRVSFRIGVVLAAQGGALSLMRFPFSLGLGGPLGTGEQWFPWIELEDLARLITVAAFDERYRGAINATAPEPARNREFTRALAEILRRPAFLRVPAFALRALLGDLASELLGSRRVVPERATELGFEFSYSRIGDALRALLA